MRHLQISALFLLITPCLTAQSVPSTINYQGRLTDNSPTQTPINTTVNMQFEIWDVPTGGTIADRLWQEPLSGSASVVVTGGIFNVLLGASAGGSSVPIPATVFTTGTTTRYLQIIANGEILAPRQTISATSFANQAQNAASAANSNLLGGVALSGLQQRAAANPLTCTTGGQYLSSVAADGAPVCSTPSGTTYTGSGTIALAGNSFSLNSCAANQIFKMNGAGTAWSCGADAGLTSEVDGVIGNEVTDATNGTLTRSGAGTAVSPYTLGVNTAVIQNRVSGSCSVGNPITAIAADGSVTCSQQSAEATSSSGANTFFTALNTCVNYTAGSVTITTPAAGNIMVTANAQMLLYHATGTEDKIQLAIGTTATDCGPFAEDTLWDTPASYPAFTNEQRSFTVMRRFAVGAAGTYTYYLNGLKLTGGVAAGTQDNFNFDTMYAVYLH